MLENKDGITDHMTKNMYIYIAIINIKQKIKEAKGKMKVDMRV